MIQVILNCHTIYYLNLHARKKGITNISHNYVY